MRRGREELVTLANTIRVLACESVFKRRLPGADAKCGDQAASMSATRILRTASVLEP